MIELVCGPAAGLDHAEESISLNVPGATPPIPGS